MSNNSTPEPHRDIDSQLNANRNPETAIERLKLAFEEKKWSDEFFLRKQEIAIRRRDIKDPLWKSPLLIAIFVATLAAVGNAVVAWLNGSLQRSLDAEKSHNELILESKKAEESRILELIKTGDPDKAKVNLQFLLSAGLIRDEDTASSLRSFLANASPNELPGLPASVGPNVARGRHLLVLSIGIGDYESSPYLKLRFPKADAHDIATILMEQEGRMYAKVELQYVVDEEASKLGILRDFATVEGLIKPDSGDMFVMFYSGHSAFVDGTLYLIPYDVDVRDPTALSATAISVSELSE